MNFLINNAIDNNRNACSTKCEPRIAIKEEGVRRHCTNNVMRVHTRVNIPPFSLKICGYIENNAINLNHFLFEQKRCSREWERRVLHRCATAEFVTVLTDAISRHRHRSMLLDRGHGVVGRAPSIVGEVSLLSCCWSRCSSCRVWHQTAQGIHPCMCDCDIPIYIGIWCEGTSWVTENLKRTEPF